MSATRSTMSSTCRCSGSCSTRLALRCRAGCAPWFHRSEVGDETVYGLCAALFRRRHAAPKAGFKDQRGPGIRAGATHKHRLFLVQPDLTLMITSFPVQAESWTVGRQARRSIVVWRLWFAGVLGMTGLLGISMLRSTPSLAT